MTEVPSVEEYRKKFAYDIANELMLEQRRQFEFEQERKRRDAVCNKYILDTIAKDTQFFKKVSWTFDSTNCNAGPSIAILKQKGYIVKDNMNYCEMTECEYDAGTFTVTLKKY